MSSEASRRFAEKTPRQTEFGNLRLEIRDQALCVNGSSEWKHLAAQDFQVLWYLIKAKGGVVYTRELVEWLMENAPLENKKNPDYVDAVYATIARLRKSVGEMKNLRVRIPETHKGNGYYLEEF